MSFDEVLKFQGIGIFRVSEKQLRHMFKIAKEHGKFVSSGRKWSLGKSLEVRVDFRDIKFFEEKIGKKHNASETKKWNEGDAYFSQKSRHKQAIQEAIKEGKKIPNKVLKDYPDLQPTTSMSKTTTKKKATTKKPKLKRITKKEVIDAFLKRPSTKISAMELSFFLKLYDSNLKEIILKDGKMETAMFKKLEQSNLVDINGRYDNNKIIERASRTQTGTELYQKFDAFRTSYTTEKLGGVIDFSKKVVEPKKATPKKKEVSAKELIHQIKSLQDSTLSKQAKYIPKAKISTSSKPLRKSNKDIRDGRIKSDWLVNGREASYWRDNPPRLILNPQDKSFRQGIKLPDEYIKNAYDFELLKKMFGVKGFEFGRWTNYEDRYNYLVGLSAALYDLAETLAIPKTKIGLNLGIAFGARGASKALAHYEPYNHIINLTRFKGVERLDNGSYQRAFLQSGGLRSLTHEWGHAFDYYVGGGANQSLSNGRVSLHQIPYFSNVGLVGLMKNVLLKLCYKDKEGKEKSAFGQRVVDTESEYYARCNEIFARSFEVYVYLKMKQKGYFNVFLAKGKYDDDGKLTNKFSKRVYPTENEMRNVMKDFDLLISKMKQKL